MPWVLKKKCIACKKCVRKCPVDAISMSRSKAIINDHLCIYCGKCVKICPVHAILKDKEKVELDVKRDLGSFKKEMKEYRNAAPKSRMIKSKLKQLKIKEQIIRNTMKEIRQLKL